MRHTFAGEGPRFRPGVVLATGALLLVLPLAVVACGDGGGDEREGVTVGTTQPRSTPVATTEIPESQPPAVEETMKDSTTEGESVEGESMESEPDVTEPLPPVTYQEAEAVFLEGRYGEAVDLFARYTERRPENAWGHYMLGLSVWKSGDPVGAEEFFRDALELDPRHEKSLVNLARVLLEQDRPEEARESIEKVIEANPESNRGLRVLGRVHYALGQTDEAIEAYKRAILVDDEDVWSMNNLGLIYIREGRFEEATLPLARATELEGGVATFQNNLGIALERSGHSRAAGDAYRSALSIEDGYDKAAVSLARVEDLVEVREAVPVDLSALSLKFQDEIEGWRQAKLAETTPEEKSDTTDVGTVEVSGLEKEDDS